MKISTFWHMPVSQKKMFFINFLLCGLARLAINVLPFKWLTRYFGQFCKAMTVSTIISKTKIQQASVIGHSIRLAAKYTPWYSNCLTQALVATFWCRHYNIPYMLFLGFTKSATQLKRFDGHAWVTAGPVAISGGDGFYQLN